MTKKRLLITGGSGYLGINLANRLKGDFDVTLCARNNKRNAEAKEKTGCNFIPMDVANIESVRDAFSEVKPHVVIHAAATKFVDLSEVYPMETIDVNILGSQNIARVAIENKVDTVIGISTDKACPPVRNMYGLSKAAMEKLFCLMDGKSDTKFACVRYGNVAWSTGSVLPVWEKMIVTNNEIRTTGPEMTRYFFTVLDAVDLVMSALDLIDSLRGKILVVPMKSAKMIEIANVWSELTGCKITSIQGRPGERNLEYLIGESELKRTKIVYNKYGFRHFMISPNDIPDYTPGLTELHSENAIKLTKKEITQLLTEKPNVT